MDNFDLMSDDDLRIRLLQYGFPNLPITQTTRKTLVKKLRNHLANTNSNLRQTTSLVTRYSSGEESDTVNRNKKADGAKSRKARMTVSGAPGGRSNQPMPPPSFTTRSQPGMRTSTPSSSFSRAGINTSGGKKSSVYVSPVIINDSEDDDIDWNMRRNRSTSNSSKTISPRGRTAELYTTLDSSMRNGSNGHDEDVDDQNSTSDYTRRLLQLREGSLQKQNSLARKRKMYSSQRLSDYQPVSENDIVYHAEPSLEPAHIPLNTAIKNFINRLDAAYGFKQTFVPMLLVTSLIVFFMLIIFVYVTIAPDIENILSPSKTLYVPCNNHQEADASYACIEEHSLEASLNLLKIIAPEMQARAVAKRCGDKVSKISNVMCVKDFWQYFSDNHPQSRYVTDNSHGLELMKDLHNVEYLVDRNKQWGIQNVDADGEPISLDDVVERRAHQSECLAILKPKLPITCTIYTKIHTFCVIFGTLAVICFGVFVVRKFYNFVLQIKERRRQQIDHLIREICSILMEKAIQDKENPSIVVNHLRERIIEPSKRSELAWAWNEAIAYISQHDSRIHTGFENINGEDLKVISWTDDTKNLSATGSVQTTPQQTQQRFTNARFPQPLDGRTPVTLKKWMGAAFDKSNKIKDPPTNCLKIRQMFDKYEANNPNLTTIIQDTILHKLRDKNCKIYDIQLDLKTCCVYIKCASCADAGIVHAEINGWWLESGLVVVKFLKQDKYHQRFPNAINSCAIMYPSSNVYVTQNDATPNGHDDYFDDDDDDYE